jgi:predicted DNA-binding protein (MmcQ/YjbR family)
MINFLNGILHPNWKAWQDVLIFVLMFLVALALVCIVLLLIKLKKLRTPETEEVKDDVSDDQILEFAEEGEFGEIVEETEDEDGGEDGEAEEEAGDDDSEDDTVYDDDTADTETEDAESLAYAGVEDSGDVIIDEEAKAILKEAEKARKKFVTAKKAGKAVVIPELAFTLSREDVLDYIEDTALNKEKYPISADAKVKAKKHFPDSLLCGEWCFGLMYEKDSVIKFKLRFDKETAIKLIQEYTSFSPATFPGGEDWYDLIIDASFTSKREVFSVLDKAYDYVFKKYYSRGEDGCFVTDTAAAKSDLSTIGTEVSERIAEPDHAYDTAVSEREEALAKIKAKYKLTFKMTRKRLLSYARRSMGGTVHERPKKHLPASLKSGGKTYALVYEKAGEVWMIVRVSDKYAEWLSLRHREVRRARFPKNRNWYVVPIDGSFPNAQMVYRVLKRAKKFVE